jgi:drug/metabolite transporter (DMT)-like permease
LITKKNNIWLHAAALAIVVIWGTTFVSTKLLLSAGLEPQDIFFYRFSLAYIGIWLLKKDKSFARNITDEALMALLGVTGGSIYFLAENMALEYTLASNVALLVSIAPLLTAIAAHFFTRGEKLSRGAATGSLLALAGVAMVVFNGNFVLKMNPRGDLLSFATAACWAVYTVILKGLSKRYSPILITRKVFFYGVLTIMPFYLLRPLNHDPALLARPVVWGNLLYLGIAASLLCFYFWNMIVRRLGAVRTTNYVYFAPPVTLIASAIVLGESVTWIALLGAGLILAGVVIADRVAVGK